jgi:hypothetical protein
MFANLTRIATRLRMTGARFSTGYLAASYDKRLNVPVTTPTTVASGVDTNLQPATISAEVWYKCNGTESTSAASLVFLDHYPYASHVAPYYGLHLRLSYVGGTGYYPFAGLNIAGSYRSLDGSSFVQATTAGRWIHLVVTVQGSEKKLYVNGALLISGASAGALVYNATDSRIGAPRNAGVTYRTIPGEVRLVKIHNLVLTAANIAQLYTAGAPR